MLKKIKSILIALVIIYPYSPADLKAGLFDSLKKELQKAVPVPSSPSNNKQKQNLGSTEKKSKGKVEDGKVDYSSSAIISFLCQKSPLPGLPTDPAPKPQVVANDFGKSIEETRKILRENFSKPIGPIWAKSLPYYADAFDQTEAKLLFNAFIASNGKNINVLSQLQQMSKMEDTSLDYQQEYNDARFAYGLILAHYNKFHKKGAVADDIIDTAYREDQSGAVYIIGKKFYYGWGTTRNVNKAADIISEAHEKGKFKRATELWHVVALDPQYGNRKMYLGMKKQAAQIKARLEREMKKKSNSVLRRRINRLNDVRIRALKKLGEAFNVAEELAKVLAGIQDLRNQADPSQQLVEKNTKIGDEASKFMTETIAKSNSTLDPKGEKLVKEAFDMNRLVIAQLGATTAQFLTNPGGSGSLFSDMNALAPALDRGINASCQLNTSIQVYGEKKNVAIEQSDIVPDEEDEFKDET